MTERKYPKISFMVFTAIILLTSIASADTELNLTSQQFLEQVRKNHPVDTWGLLQGEVSHKRKGSETITSPIRFAIRFTPSRMLAKITIDKNESYTVGQPYSEIQPSVIADESSLAIANLANFGLKPEDLTMTFLYWKFIEELESTNVQGIDCRVFLLQNPETKEEVKVYIGSSYFYPIEIVWLKPGETSPYRTCFINSFKEVDNLWTPDSFTLKGPGWRTNVDFASDKIQLGYIKDGVPKDLF
ncbi:MAG TPA: hypothetical protein DD381_14325 [Lentisphaeria bacterium]|nr:MAG: hypothetical protein A2X47_00940 [Lentisphaerae bacterium GWF2_38_69]HBM17501.1 hypothetical protein [Lentisphaeria bacterium]